MVGDVDCCNGGGGGGRVMIVVVVVDVGGVVLWSTGLVSKG